LAEVYPALGNLAAATSSFTTIEESGGLIGVRNGTGTTMVTEECTLTRTQTGFAGTCVGRASVTRMYPPYPSAERQYELPVQASTDAAERFLREIAMLPVADGPYRPMRLPDSRFHRELRVVSGAGTVRVFTDSLSIPPPPALVASGAGKPPWAVEYRGHRMVTDPDGPTRAFRLLGPYLGGIKKMSTDERQKAMDELERMLLTPEPSPSPLP